MLALALQPALDEVHEVIVVPRAKANTIIIKILFILIHFVVKKINSQGLTCVTKCSSENDWKVIQWAIGGKRRQINKNKMNNASEWSYFNFCLKSYYDQALK